MGAEHFWYQLAKRGSSEVKSKSSFCFHFDLRKIFAKVREEGHQKLNCNNKQKYFALKIGIVHIEIGEVSKNNHIFVLIFTNKKFPNGC